MSELSTKQLHPYFAAEVSGVDLRGPLDDETIDAIAKLGDRYSVLVFHDMLLTDEEQLAFSRRFGELELPSTTTRHTMDKSARIKHREISDISNLDQNNQVRTRDNRMRMYAMGNQLWHTDASFRATPAKWSMLSARIVPEGGAPTQYADLRAAYDALSDTMRAKIEGLVAEHSIFYSREMMGFTDFSPEERAALPPVPQTIVRRHPGSDRKTLYLASHASHIVDMPVPEGRALLRELIEFATQPQFIYQHDWRVGDFVIWDNRCTMHRGRPYDDLRVQRDLRRTTIKDTASTLVQAGLSA